MCSQECLGEKRKMHLYSEVCAQYTHREWLPALSKWLGYIELKKKTADSEVLSLD